MNYYKTDNGSVVATIGKLDFQEISEEEYFLVKSSVDKSMEENAEQRYWNNISYDEAVNAEIRKKYSESQEFAILRQKDEKPEEYASYYAYCEECKAYVKSKKDLVS